MLSVQRIVVRGFVCSAPLWLGQHTHTQAKASVGW